MTKTREVNKLERLREEDAQKLKDADGIQATTKLADLTQLFEKSKESMMTLFNAAGVVLSPSVPSDTDDR